MRLPAMAVSAVCLWHIKALFFPSKALEFPPRRLTLFKLIIIVATEVKYSLSTPHVPGSVLNGSKPQLCLIFTLPV